MIILKPVFAFFYLLLIARILGNKQMGHLTYFNYITGITLGTLTANIISSDTELILNSIVGVGIWGGLVLIITWLSKKSSTLKVIFQGKPIIIIKQGKLLAESLRTAKLNIDDLLMMLRNKNIFSVRDVEYAILEPNGELTLLERPGLLPVTRSDMRLDVNDYKNLPASIIIKGKMIEKNLEELGLDPAWIYQELERQEVKNIEEVFYAEITEEGKLYIN